MHAPKKNQEDVSLLLMEFVRLIGRSIKPGEGSQNVSFAQMKALYLISEEKLPTMKDIADNFGITPPSATSMINRFVKEGYIKRVLNPNDRRTVNLKLTPLGEKQLEKCTRLMREKMSELIKVLSAEEKKTFAKIIKKIIDNHN